MKYIGNHSSWVPKELIELMKTQPGQEKSLYNDPSLSTEYKQLSEPWFSSGEQVYEEYDYNLPELPFTAEGNVTYSIVKLNPGQMKFLHSDLGYSKRYTMFLGDWSIGHIFEFKDKMLSEYKLGDVYEWTDPNIEYCSINIGYEPAYLLQIDLRD